MSKINLFFNDEYDDSEEVSLNPRPKIKVWLDNLVDSIDNGTFFREPAVSIYRIIGVISLVSWVAVCLLLTDNWEIRKSLFGSTVNTVVTVIVAFAMGILSMMIWVNRSNKLRKRIAMGNDIVVIPLVADFVQTWHECLGLAIMVISTVCGVYFAFVGQLFCDRYYLFGNYPEVLLRTLGSTLFVVLIGYGVVVIGHLLGESMRALATLVNNVRDIRNVQCAAAAPVAEPEKAEPAAEEEPEKTGE